MQQNAKWRESVLPASISARVAIEAGVSHFWYPIVGDRGRIVGIDCFGGSAPAAQLFEQFGFTVANVSAQLKKCLNA